MRFKVGDRVAAPVCSLFEDRKETRSRYGYDVGTVVATGRHKKTGRPAVKVNIPVSDSVWAKRVTKEPELEKWFIAADCDKI